MRKKLVLIGAGSAVFTRALVADLVRNAASQPWHLALVDIDAAALDVAGKLCRKMITYSLADVELSASTDRRDVLPGADYIVTTVGVGGRRAWEQDVFIPRKYGIFQPVGDSVMPGGISRAMRMIPAMLDITRDVISLCPRAAFFNYSNPMTAICRAVRKATGFPLTGLCHGVHDSEGYLARLAGLDRKNVSSYAVGLNHLTFIRDFLHEGQDAWPLVRQAFENLKKTNPDALRTGSLFGEINGRKEPLQPFSWELFGLYGAFPAPGDRHVTEFMFERFVQAGYYGKTLGIDAYSFEDTIRHGDQAYADMAAAANSPEPLREEYFRKSGGEHEQLVDIISSLEHDGRRVFSVNLPNNGAIANLPADAVLELPAAATAKGLLPLQIRDFPDALAGLISRHLSIAEIVVAAALQGDARLFAEAILMGGYLSDRNKVTRMVDDLIAAQRAYLPQFV